LNSQYHVITNLINYKKFDNQLLGY
jgi:hypothetical protein